MPWLLDTNVWIEILKKRNQEVRQTLLSHPNDQIFLCSIVKAELWHGARKYTKSDFRLKVLEKLFAGFISLPFDDDAAWCYGDIRHQLEVAGSVIGPNDLKIAAICLANNLTLVTANTGEFSRVRNLRVEDWSSA